MSIEDDLVIVGAGSGGLPAAAFAAQLGVRVALVEKDRIGGDCTWTGCVPSKTLLKTAKAAHEMRTAARYGLSSAQPEVDIEAVMAHVRHVIGEIAIEESPEALRADGIDVVLGQARFVDPHTLVAGDTTLVARRLVIAGGGPIGCEMAQAFQRLGADVTLLASRDRLLPRDDPKASRVLGEVFESEGINVVYNARVERAWQDEDGIHVGAAGDEWAGDALLIASGRRPTVSGLDLEYARVLYDEQGIQVDDNLRTSQRHIFAAGDCTGGLQFTHYAGWQATMAARNPLLPGASEAVSD